MKSFIFLTFAALFYGMITTKVMSQGQTKNVTAEQASSAGSVRHVVLFKFKDSATPEQVKEVENAFSALPSRINTITGYEWGTNMSPENLAQGFTHCFILTFKNATDRDAYLPHPAHKEFGKMLGPHLDKVLVIDFVNK